MDLVSYVEYQRNHRYALANVCILATLVGCFPATRHAQRRMGPEAIAYTRKSRVSVRGFCRLRGGCVGCRNRSVAGCLKQRLQF